LIGISLSVSLELEVAIATVAVVGKIDSAHQLGAFAGALDRRDLEDLAGTTLKDFHREATIGRSGATGDLGFLAIDFDLDPEIANTHLESPCVEEV